MEEAGLGKGVPGRESSVCKARNLRGIGGWPWADVGRGFAVAVTHGTLEKEVLGMTGDLTTVAGDKTQENVNIFAQRKRKMWNI